MFVMNPSSLNGGLVLLLLFLFSSGDQSFGHRCTLIQWWPTIWRQLSIVSVPPVLIDGSTLLMLMHTTFFFFSPSRKWRRPIWQRRRRMDAEEDKRCRSQACAVLSFFSGETVVASWSFWGNCSFSLRIVCCTAVCNRWLSTHFLSFLLSLSRLDLSFISSSFFVDGFCSNRLLLSFSSFSSFPPESSLAINSALSLQEMHRFPSSSSWSPSQSLAADTSIIQQLSFYFAGESTCSFSVFLSQVSRLLCALWCVSAVLANSYFLV